jgi:hypothetical protein
LAFETVVGIFFVRCAIGHACCAVLHVHRQGTALFSRLTDEARDLLSQVADYHGV